MQREIHWSSDEVYLIPFHLSAALEPSKYSTPAERSFEGK